MSDFIQAYTELAKAVEDEIAQRRADAARHHIEQERQQRRDADGDALGDSLGHADRGEESGASMESVARAAIA